MATLNTQSFTQLVSNSVTAVQGYARTLVDLSVGSVLRAMLESTASVILWLQGLILQLLTTTRAASSVGSDLDSWMADYGVTRISAVQAQGAVTFARFTPTNVATIAVGQLVQTADGSQRFAVIADATQPTFSAAAGAYVIPAGTSSAPVTVQAQNAGTQGNALAGQISALSQPIPGIDTVTNAAGFVNGVNPETDAALRTRFLAYVASLSKATKNAVGFAITSLQQGLVYTLVENAQYNGTAQLGYFYVVVDDGTGTPSANLLTNVSSAVDAVRPLGSSFGVFAPVVVSVPIVLTITAASGYVKAAMQPVVQAAVQAYVNSLPLGTSLPYSRIAQVAYDSTPGIANVQSVTVSGATADITATSQQVIKASSVVVS
jgi:uncharacterized phage protein gp47/JayE